MSEHPLPESDRPLWFTANPAGHSERYVARMREAVAAGTLSDGEARFVDELLPRNARVLDAGCGQGRVGAALHALGHQVTGLDADPVLVEAARTDHVGPQWLLGDLSHASDLVEPLLDAVVLAGNVMVFLAPGSEAWVLGELTGLLVPGGLLVAGFATDRAYTVADFDRDCASAGLSLERRWAGWDRRTWRPDADWAVSVARRA